MQTKINFKNNHLKKLLRSKLAVALPVTFLILFVSTLGIVAFTYYFSVERINVQGTTLKVSTAKQNLLSLDDAIVSTLWKPGSSSTYELSDSGGQTHIQPEDNVLTLAINDTADIDDIIFNASIGKIIYELPYSSTSQTGLYLKGDSRTIANQSGSSTSQLCIENGEEYAEIQLRYRPTLTYVYLGEDEGKAVNNIRIYIVNLNSSDQISLYGTLPLHISCTATQLTTQNFEVAYELDYVTITSVLDGSVDSIIVPIISTPSGAIIQLETVICDITVERWLR